MGSKQEHAALRRYHAGARWKFIDEELFWVGEITRRRIMDAFGVSEETAKTDIRDYRRGFAQDVVRDPRDNVYRVPLDFTPRLKPPPDPERWLARLAGDAAPVVPVESVPEVERRTIDRTVLQSIVRAMHQGVEVFVHYRSAREPAARGRWIRPLAFLHDGFRWSVRCFQHRSAGGGFWGEMVLDRIEEVAAETRPADPALAGHDEGWDLVELELCANPRLPSEHREGIEAQYGMTRGMRALSVRQCMLAYFLKRYQLDEPVTLKAPHQAPLALRDRSLADQVPDAMRVPLATSDAPAPRLMQALRARLPGISDQEILERALEALLDSTPLP
jgi:hypothetical protein